MSPAEGCSCGAPVPCVAPRFGGEHVPAEAWAAEGVCVGGELDGQQVPLCPTCGGEAVLVEAGVEMVTPGMAARARPSRPRARCSEGHWFSLVEG